MPLQVTPQPRTSHVMQFIERSLLGERSWRQDGSADLVSVVDKALEALVSARGAGCASAAW